MGTPAYDRENTRRINLKLNKNTDADIIRRLEEVKDEEEEAYENLPESLQECERGEQMSEYISTLDDVYGSIEDLDSQITEIVEG